MKEIMLINVNELKELDELIWRVMNDDFNNKSDINFEKLKKFKFKFSKLDFENVIWAYNNLQRAREIFMNHCEDFRNQIGVEP